MHHWQLDRAHHLLENFMSYEIKQKLIAAAEELLDRKLTQAEADELYRRFENAFGSKIERATQTLGLTTNMTPAQIRAKRASDDNCDRVIGDLENVLRK
ncbi:hypothetical protein CGZ80_01335 [Rhodopirellula sp. MGV]|nr:hypothetical protein CGZ80_01335 [Rhodopirellula sp. MGV]PNY38297.1 hypothetical protein C2E31_03005 [Rhodopirellula baltica]